MLKIIFIFVMSFNIYAQDFSFTGITSSDLESLGDEYIANFSHTTASAPISLGSIFGFEIGAVAGFTDAPQTLAVTKRVDADSTLDKLPHVALLARVSIPMGLTAEATFVPTLETDNAEYSRLSLGLQYNFYELSLFHFAAKAHFATSDFELTQTIGSDTNGKVEFSNSSFGLMALAGANLLILRPYAGIGFVKGSSELSFSATNGSIFNTSLTTGSSAEVSPSSSHIVAGVELSLLLVKIAAEYDRLFGTNRYSAKLTFGF